MLKLCGINPSYVTAPLSRLGCERVQHDDARFRLIGCRDELVKQWLVPLDADQSVLRLPDQAVVRRTGRNSVNAHLLDWNHATCRKVKNKVKRVQQFANASWLRELSQLTYHIMVSQCYLPPGRRDIPALTPAEAGTRFSNLGGWLEMVCPPQDGHPSRH